ncbi:MAG TPA: shikimate kinase, partial [Rubrobacteraceae bacterium]|nr:shikimate kinase [Rubrobacteraceae bacterium]
MEGPVAIVGYMGCGKTTVGRALASKLGWEFVDLDRAITKATGSAISEIFRASGEEHFRNLEHRALLDVLDGTPERVVACGGGIILRPENRKLLGRTAAVFLMEEVNTLYGRTRGGDRPLRADSLEAFERRYAERLPLYEEVAELKVEIQGRPPTQVAEEIARWL